MGFLLVLFDARVIRLERNCSCLPLASERAHPGFVCLLVIGICVIWLLPQKPACVLEHPRVRICECVSRCSNANVADRLLMFHLASSEYVLKHAHVAHWLTVSIPNSEL